MASRIYTLFVLLLILPFSGLSQISISPDFPTADDEITITYDASKGTTGLVGAGSIVMHSGVVISSPTGTDWNHVVGQWGNPDSPGKMTNVGTDLWEIKLTPRSYYAAAGLPASTPVYRIGMVFREAGPCGGYNGATNNCKEGKTDSNGDFFFDISQGGLDITFTSPSKNPLFVNAGEEVSVSVTTSENCNITLFNNDVSFQSGTGVSTLTGIITEQNSGQYIIKAIAENGTEEASDSVSIIVRSAGLNEPRPAGIKPGINYDIDPSIVTLCLLAPQKSSVYLTGDFNDWKISPEYQMKKDGDYFWLELNNLEAGKEIAYQYLVDETYFIADPYADKILDPLDKYIPSKAYPNLKQFPSQGLHNTWYGSRVSVFQTNQTAYLWQNDNFSAPPKEKLVIYELLIRDFFGPGEQNYQNLIDTLGYFKKLGINAIQLMPIMEFNGNESWGYNPAFMFAPDKFYGTKNDLKAFIDAAHGEGIAVILDIALNHQDQPSPYVVMYWDEANGRPAVTSPFFNSVPKHPFNVFFDFNHSSSYTQNYVDSVNAYWLDEYKVDGFRFDLSKGFTQKFTSDAGAMSAYDFDRVSLLRRMANALRQHNPNAYVILEHFADNSEEKDLSASGMMLWGNVHWPATQNLMGYNSENNLSWAYYQTRQWTQPNLVTYMESHDEERTMFKAKAYGNFTETYSVKYEGTALNRGKAIAAIFYSIPGPKMLWQFGEFGYDVSKTEGGDLSIKPTKWEYLENENRLSMFQTVSELIHLRQQYPIFNSTSVTQQLDNGLWKEIVLKAVPFKETPASSNEMSAVTIANFDVTTRNEIVNFPHTGKWYNYFSGEEITVSSTSQVISLLPGDFNLFTNFPLTKPEIVLNTEVPSQKDISIYPNPTNSIVNIEAILPLSGQLDIYNLQGVRMMQIELEDSNQQQIDVHQLPSGQYILRIGSIGFTTKLLVK